ncbi:MAG: post-transcriptional regulator [Bacilli bacterium]
MDIVFGSLEELYERVKPALVTKSLEMCRSGYNYIKPEDVWNYLKEIKWKNSQNLALHEMVDDILNSEEILVDNYVKEKLNRGNREVYFN